VNSATPPEQKRRLPFGLFSATVLLVLITHFAHVQDIALDHGLLGQINGERLTRALVCIPLFALAIFVVFSERYRREKKFGYGTMAIAFLCWMHFLISN
jgi:hypothetical protein